MKFGKLYGGDSDEHNGAGSVELSNLQLQSREHWFLEWYDLTEYNTASCHPNYAFLLYE